MEEMLHQLTDGKHPMISRVSAIQGGAGFLPSTVWQKYGKKWRFASPIYGD